MKLVGDLESKVNNAKNKEEAKGLIEEAGMLLSDEELETVGGGYGGSGHYMTVGNCDGGYLALRPMPFWDPDKVIKRLFPDDQVFTYGSTIRGTGLNGVSCSYTYVSFKGTWGWANSDFLK